MLGKFKDSWVIDRALFEFVNQGSCSCCGLSHAGMNIMMLMSQCSDLETDDGRKEKKSPWPPTMHQEVWSERVRMRRLLKDDMKKYEEFWHDHGEAFSKWWGTLEVSHKKRFFQCPKAELINMFKNVYHFKESFLCVLCAVAEQVEKFPQTCYPPDGVTSEELTFDAALTVTKHGTFVVKEDYYEGEMNSFLSYVSKLGGPKLLVKASKLKSKDENSEDEDGDNEGEDAEEDIRSSTSSSTIASAHSELKEEGSKEMEKVKSEFAKGELVAPDNDTPSFRSDRRLVRMVLFRWFVDSSISSFKRNVV